MAPDFRTDFPTMPRIAAATILALLLMVGRHAHAADPKVITLSCDGTSSTRSGLVDDAKPEPTGKVGVVVNLDERTVSFLGYVARITDVDTANINFGGPQIGGNYNGYSIGITGNLDRVTGHMIATTTTSDPTQRPYDPNMVMAHYDVLCRATNRVF
jgi:hypothetical protein